MDAFLSTYLLLLNRAPTTIDWRHKWNDALIGQKCTNGNLICIEHFRAEDLSVAKKGKFSLKKDAVPTIFPTIREEIISDCTTVEIDATEEPLANTIDEIDPLLCSSCSVYEETIKVLQAQLVDIKIQNEAMQQKFHSQNNKIENLTTELSELNAIFSSSRLAHFCLNANQSEKVLKVIFLMLFYNNAYVNFLLQ